MHQTQTVAAPATTEMMTSEPAASEITSGKQPWAAPALDVLPLSHTYNNISALSDGTNGS
jgi:hypothetical protein